MRWRRRGRFPANPPKRHYHSQYDEESRSIAFCKKEWEPTYRTTSEVHEVNCKNCLKKMLKTGVINEDEAPASVVQSLNTPKAPKVEDFKNDYLKRLGVF